MTWLDMADVCESGRMNRNSFGNIMNMLLLHVFFEIFGSLLDSAIWRDVSCCLFTAVCCPVPRLFCC